MKSYNLIAVAFLSALPPSLGQLVYNVDPSVKWIARGEPVRQGNGVFLSPDENFIVASSETATLTAWDAYDGTELWTYTPVTGNAAILSCESGITFVDSGMLVYSVIVDENLPSAMSFVVAISMLGEELWVSETLEGVASGTPVASSDGEFVFLVRNTNSETEGHFTILDSQAGGLFFNQHSKDAPFAPVGIYHSPAEGYYDGGEHNSNDILVWSVQPKPTDEVVGPGMTFAFQFPIGFAGELDGLAYNILGEEVRDFQAVQKPVFANDGRSLYWGTSRSQFRCWVGSEGLNRFRFSRPRTNTAGFTRGSPPRQAVFAPLALSHNKTSPSLFGGSAAREFVKLNSDFSESLMIATSSLVTTMAHVSPDDLYVYYVEFGGRIHQASTEDLMDNWIFNIQVPVQGDFALKNDGTILYVADIAGTIQALQVADLPSESPSMAPSAAPSVSPSKGPSDTPSSPPSSAPTLVPEATSDPTGPPTIGPTLKPTSRPEAGPFAGGDSSEIDSGDLDVDLSERSESRVPGILPPFVFVCFTHLVLPIV